MASLVYSGATVGLEGRLVEVESDILGSGLPNFILVGLPDTAVKEAKNRVESALKNSGFSPPYAHGRVTVNLAPADLPKAGPLYDLPIALSFLISSGQLQAFGKEKMFLGELSLSGDLRPVQGVLSMAMDAKKRGIQELFVPYENAQEASSVGDIEVYAFKTLRDLALHLRGEKQSQCVVYIQEEKNQENIDENDFSYIRGQGHAKRALEIAASGGHNILLSGPPGSGKTLLARAMASILPELSRDESLEVTTIYSVSGKLESSSTLLVKRPFRSPHHSASAVALIGGGSNPKPGEVTLAHRGVLFLDEFPEFSRSVLENLRQPLEEGYVTVSRAKQTLAFPANFVLVAAMNPCPCGNAGDPERLCSCSSAQRIRYTQKLSGPLLDRIDLQIEVPRLDVKELQTKHKQEGETSEEVRKRVEKTRMFQKQRFEKEKFSLNSELNTKAIENHCPLDDSCKDLLRKAITSLRLSPRGYYRLIKTARTIADIEESEHIKPNHIAEAVQYRFRVE